MQASFASRLPSDGTTAYRIRLLRGVFCPERSHAAIEKFPWCGTLVAAVESLHDAPNWLPSLYCIRINRQWRICFRWHEGNAWDVAIVDYH
jgi:hypothetical protein